MKNNTHEGTEDVVKMTSVAKEEKLTASVILAVISGSLMLISGVASLAMLIGFQMYGGHRMFGMMMYGGLQNMVSLISPWLIGLSISSVICGGIILYCSYKLHTTPQESRTYGLVILIVSAFGIFHASGFWLGSILGIISGILAVSKK